MRSQCTGTLPTWSLTVQRPPTPTTSPTSDIWWPKLDNGILLYGDPPGHGTSLSGTPPNQSQQSLPLVTSGGQDWRHRTSLCRDNLPILTSGGYCREAGGTHPTGMLSCFIIFTLNIYEQTMT